MFKNKMTTIFFYGIRVVIHKTTLKHHFMKRIIIFVCTGLMASTLLTSCTDEAANNAAGTFKVKMTDAPGDYAALNIEITSVDAYHENQGWVNLSNQTTSLNVLSLTNGSEITLANTAQVQAGLYTRLRIRYAPQASITLQNSAGSLQAGFIGGVNETEIIIHQEINAQTGVDLLLDFNVAQSVIETSGQYIIDPVITVITDPNTGIKGQVKGASHAAVKLDNAMLHYSTYITASGEFLIRGVEPGIYTLTIFPQEAAQPTIINNVTISDGEIHSMGNIQL